MNETNIYHLVIEHPIITFFVSMVLMAVLILFIGVKFLSYREKVRMRKSKDK